MFQQNLLFGIIPDSDVDKKGKRPGAYYLGESRIKLQYIVVKYTQNTKYMHRMLSVNDYKGDCILSLYLANDHMGKTPPVNDNKGIFFPFSCILKTYFTVFMHSDFTESMHSDSDLPNPCNLKSQFTKITQSEFAKITHSKIALTGST